MINNIRNDQFRGGKPDPESGCDRTPNRFCLGCPQAQQEGHESYGYGWPTAPIEPEQRYAVSQFTSMRYRLWRTAVMLRGLIGWASGFPFNASASISFSESVPWFCIPIPNQPRHLGMRLQNGADPRNYPVSLTSLPNNILRAVAIQPGDVIQFSPPSCLANKCRPMVTRIVSFDPQQNDVVVELDQDVSQVLFSIDRAGPELMQFASCVSWREFGEPEHWQRITPAIPFRGKQRRVRILTENIPPNGLVELRRTDGASAAIVTPRFANPDFDIPQSFRLQGVLRSTGRTVDITDLAVQSGNLRGMRVKVSTDRNGQSQTFLCLGTEDHLGQSVFADLRGEYSVFLIDFVTEATASEDFEVWSFDRCRYAARDFSNSIGVFGGSSGGGWYCAKSDSQSRAEKADSFPATGKCFQCGTCSQFAPLEYSQEEEFRPFGVPFLGRVISEIWAGVSVVFRQLFPGQSTNRAWRVSRPGGGHTSLSELLGMPKLTSRLGMHQTTLFPLNDIPLLGLPEVVMDDQDNETLVAKRGAWWDLDHTFPANYQFGKQQNFPAPGIPFQLVDFWNDRADPFFGRASFTRDLSGDFTRQLPRTSPRIERDNGINSGVTTADFGRANVDDGFLLVPRLRKAPGVYDRDDVVAEIFPASVDLPFASDTKILLSIRPVRTFRKQEKKVVQATVFSAQRNSDGTWDLEFNLALDFWSEVVGLPGDRRDEIYSISTGGNFVEPLDWEKSLDFYSRRKSVGGQALCRRGDWIQLPPPNDQFRFPVLFARAHGGSAPANWGQEQRRIAGELGGGFLPDFEVGTNPVTGEPLFGIIECDPKLTLLEDIDEFDPTFLLQFDSQNFVLPVGARLISEQTGEKMTVTNRFITGNQVAVTVARGSNSQPIASQTKIIWMTVTTTAGEWIRNVATRQELASLNRYYQFPETGLLVFSSAGDLVIQYADREDNFTVPSNASLSLGIAWNDWQSGSNQSVVFDPPDVFLFGTGAVIDVASIATAWTDRRNAGLRILASVDYERAATPPREWGIAPNGETQANRRDKITIADNGLGVLDAVASGLPGSSVWCVRNAGVFVDNEVPVEWAPYRERDWQPLQGVLCDGGSGRIFVSQSAYDQIQTDGEFCLRIGGQPE